MNRIQLSKYKPKQNLVGKWFQFQFDKEITYHVSSISKSIINVDSRFYLGRKTNSTISFLIIADDKRWDFITAYDNLDELKVDLL
jgi:hypothetical protein